MNRVYTTFFCFFLLVNAATAQWGGSPFTNRQFLFESEIFFVPEHGAEANSLTFIASGIKHAIKRFNLVTVPTGLCMSGPVLLKRNPNPYLQKCVLLQVTADGNQYPVKKGWRKLGLFEAMQRFPGACLREKV